MAAHVSLTVRFMSCRFDRIVLPSFSDRHAFDGFAMFINYTYLRLGAGSELTGNSQYANTAKVSIKATPTKSTIFL